MARKPRKKTTRVVVARKKAAVTVRVRELAPQPANDSDIARTSTGLAALSGAPAESRKYILGHSQIFTPEVMND
ncbi:MAG TPA: hypothetical protein VET25_06210, partial [Aestuariivirgaceae bacterium]|nr:hypothetical protein [Aestuariivirgaceae bacterium]